MCDEPQYTYRCCFVKGLDDIIFGGCRGGGLTSVAAGILGGFTGYAICEYMAVSLGGKRDR